jgi:hypothetical protein
MYKIKFMDGSSYTGGNIPNTGWNEMPEKPIVEFVYQLGNRAFVFNGFAMYNHEYEIINLGGRSILGEILLSAYDPFKGVLRVVLNTKQRCWNYEYIKFENTTGWKEGKYNTPTFNYY